MVDYISQKKMQTDYPRNESSLRKFPLRTFVPRSESSRELSYPRTKVQLELSLRGAKIPGAKIPGSEVLIPFKFRMLDLLFQKLLISIFVPQKNSSGRGRKGGRAAVGRRGKGKGFAGQVKSLLPARLHLC